MAEKGFGSWVMLACLPAGRHDKNPKRQPGNSEGNPTELICSPCQDQYPCQPFLPYVQGCLYGISSKDAGDLLILLLKPYTKKKKQQIALLCEDGCI